MTLKSELPIPRAAQEDSKSLELLRVWAASNKQHVSIAAAVWDDPANWGIMLVDLARNVADAIAVQQDTDVDSVLLRLRDAFDVEWTNPSD